MIFWLKPRVRGIKKDNRHIIKSVMIIYSLNDYKNAVLSGELNADTAYIKNVFSGDSVLRTRKLKFGKSDDLICILFFDGLAGSMAINDSIVRPIVTYKSEKRIRLDADYLYNRVLFSGELKKTTCVADMIKGILQGDTLILVNGDKTALVANTKGFHTRGIAEPKDEKVSIGPREGFEETAMYSLAMLRRKLQTPDFCAEYITVGRRTDTAVYICYLRSLSDKRLLNELKEKISRMDIDGILDSNYIAEQLRKRGGNRCGKTERPDVVAARLLEGRIAVIVDGTPVVLTMPYLFSENFQSSEDYYINAFFAGGMRLIRFLGFIISVCAPGGYIVLLNFHPELLPTDFIVSVLKARQGVPFGNIAECLFLCFSFELLREAGARNTETGGQALSIVGGLVVGQAVVEARLISAPALVIVSLSSICAILVPRLKTTVFYLRLILIVASAACGAVGFFAVMFVYLSMIVSEKSFYVSSAISLDRFNFSSLKDSLIRADFKLMKTRPPITKNKVRRK